ncbi:MAG: nitroreductase [Segniliparus sp.]|uniref:nitroreductase n=1 Tax=Segniliparus sp. TaxID=2804064 RepID=UPI003F35ECD7
MADILDFAAAVRARRSTRAFLAEPLTDAELRAVLEDAQLSPSNSNSQPWRAHIVSGAKRDELSRELLRAAGEGRVSMDFTFDPKYGGNEDLMRKVREQGGRYYETMGVAKDDFAGRGELMLRNYEFFGAPHVAFLFTPLVGDGVRVGADIGMYAQTFLLSLAAQGFAGVPQTALGLYADVVREALGVSDEFKLLFGISFGRPDPGATANSFRTSRVPVEESVVLHS